MTATEIVDILQTIAKLEPAARVPLAPVPQALRFCGVVKDFPTRSGATARVLDGFDLTLTRGEFVAVIGPSGCGKSTILRLAAGLETPTSGDVLLGRGNPVLTARYVGLGVMCQKSALAPRRTISANVAAPFELAGRPVDHERITHLLELVGLREFADAQPRQLSAEMRQRVSLARNLALEPSVLLLDDPFGTLDQESKRRLALDLETIVASEGVAVLLVTPDMGDAVVLADRVVVMSDRPGRVATARHIDFERPRRAELLHSPEFHCVVDELERSMAGVIDTVDLR